jgi:hypothetical protein
MALDATGCHNRCAFYYLCHEAVLIHPSRPIMIWQRPGKNTGHLLIVIIAIFLGACHQKIKPTWQSDAPQSAPAPVPAAADTAKKPVTIESGKTRVDVVDAVKQWPADAPAEVPRYPYGSIRKIIRTETPDASSWDMAIDRLPEHALRDYEASLKAKGFSTTSMIIPEKEGDRGNVTGIRGQVTVVLLGSGGNASLSIIQKQ